MVFERLSTRGRIKIACDKLVAATGDVVDWRWDEDYAAALAIVDAEDTGTVLGALEDIFAASWDQLDIGAAPEPVRRVAGLWGGLMAGQRLFVLEPENDPLLFVLWMPWSDRQKVSVRVSCASLEDGAPREERRLDVRRLMGVEGSANAA